jgi:archaellum component FlaF (FlaF/FlaG flagellin family)
MAFPFNPKPASLFSVGSLIVEFEVVYENKTSAANDLTKATIAFLNRHKTIAVSDETVSATTVEINSITGKSV